MGADRLPDVPFRIAELPDLIALLLPDLHSVIVTLDKPRGLSTS